jgi:hypothetical protein
LPRRTAAGFSTSEFESRHGGISDTNRGWIAAHGVNIDTEPTPEAVDAMQRLLNAAPERWRDAPFGLVVQQRERDVGRA